MPVGEELTAILDCSFGNPCIDQTMFGPTNASSAYWSSSSDLSNPVFACFVIFDNGLAFDGVKNSSGHASARPRRLKVHATEITSVSASDEESRP